MEIFREVVEADGYLSFTNTRGPANTQIQILLIDEHDIGRRSHYISVQFYVYDATVTDEIVVVYGGATTGRPHHRIGDRYSDLKLIWCKVDNAAGVK